MFNKFGIATKINSYAGYDIIKKIISFLKKEGKEVYLDELSCSEYPKREGLIVSRQKNE